MTINTEKNKLHLKDPITLEELEQMGRASYDTLGVKYSGTEENIDEFIKACSSKLVPEGVLIYRNVSFNKLSMDRVAGIVDVKNFTSLINKAAPVDEDTIYDIFKKYLKVEKFMFSGYEYSIVGRRIV